MTQVWPKVWNSGRHAEDAVRRPDVEGPGQQGVHLLDQREVAALRALRLARRAARVEDGGRVERVARHVRVDGLRIPGLVLQPGERQLVALVVGNQHREGLDAGEGRPLGALAEQRGGADQQPRAAVPQHVRDLLGLEEGVHGDDDRAEREDGVVGTRKVRDVRQQQRDRIPLPDAPGPQRAGVAAGLLPEVAVRDLLVAEDQRDVVRHPVGRLGEDARDRHRGESVGHGCAPCLHRQKNPFGLSATYVTRRAAATRIAGSPPPDRCKSCPIARYRATFAALAGLPRRGDRGRMEGSCRRPSPASCSPKSCRSVSAGRRSRAPSATTRS